MQNRKRKINSNVKFNNDFYQSQMFSIIDEGKKCNKTVIK
jgi:hypothetical protein